MKISTFSIALLLAMTGAACQNDAPKQTTPAAETPQTESAAQSPALSTSTEMPLGTMPAAESVQTESASQPAAAPQPATASGNVNPAHGQPGHQCGIPVGAPLNSTPAATNPAGQTKPAAPAKGTTQPATTTTAPGTNPPHGQPGHQCGIPVGAPLDSKPKQ